MDGRWDHFIIIYIFCYRRAIAIDEKNIVVDQWRAQRIRISISSIKSQNNMQSEQQKHIECRQSFIDRPTDRPTASHNIEWGNGRRWTSMDIESLPWLWSILSMMTWHFLAFIFVFVDIFICAAALPATNVIRRCHLDFLYHFMCVRSMAVICRQSQTLSQMTTAKHTKTKIIIIGVVVAVVDTLFMSILSTLNTTSHVNSFANRRQSY